MSGCPYDQGALARDPNPCPNRFLLPAAYVRGALVDVARAYCLRRPMCTKPDWPPIATPTGDAA
jgi:hypothetical protein